jgi:hypothetical protein
VLMVRCVIASKEQLRVRKLDRCTAGRQSTCLVTSACLVVSLLLILLHLSSWSIMRG